MNTNTVDDFVLFRETAPKYCNHNITATSWIEFKPSLGKDAY